MNTESKHVLIVDDESEICSILKTNLELLHIQVETANNGQQALELLKKKKFHAVLCDINMPQTNGMQCFSQAQVAGVVTPFIFMTGYTDQELMKQAMRLGASDFLSKPFMLKEMCEVLLRVLEVGDRKNIIEHALLEKSPELSNFVKHNERLIALLRIANNTRRGLSGPEKN